MNDDRFEDDLRAVVREIAPDQAPLTLRQRLATVTDQPATRPLWFAPMARWAAYLVIVAAAVGVAYLAVEQRQLGPGPSPTVTPVEDSARLDLGGLVLDYPASWEYHEFQFVASFFDVLGYLTTGSFDPASICTGGNDRVSCNFSGHPVEPGGVVVKFVNWAPPTDGISAEPGDTQVTVGGMPARITEATAGDILALTWRVRQPGGPSGWFEIEARMREPGTDELRRQVEAMIASLKFDPPPTILPTSGPEFDRQAAEAARQALNSLRAGADGDGYSCFASEPVVARTAEVEVVPQNTRLSQPLEVTCTTLVEADVDIWRVRLAMEWAATDEHGAGRQETEVWVTADGEAGRTQWSGDQPPYGICPPACG
jgi:hypothetical protein